MRGLLCIEPLYHQIIKGNKTQTRRSGGLEQINGCKATKNKPAIVTNPDKWEFVRLNQYHAKFWKKNDALLEVFCKPRYRVGEIVYLKEPTYTTWSNKNPQYKFDIKGSDIRILNDKDTIVSNKLYMPASAARAFIKITGIRCERLLDISDEDCIAEGIEMGYAGDHPFGYINYLMTPVYGYDYIDNTPKESFISLYKLANKLAKVGSVPPHGSLPTPPGVDNIWCWVYEFEYLKDYKP